MRILLVHDWVAGQGGAERTIGEMRDILAAAGHEVALLTSSAGSAADGTADHVAFGTGTPALQAVLQVANPSAVRAVRRAVKTFRPDVALVAMFEMHLSPAAILALQATGVRTVGFVIYYKPFCPNGRKLWPDGRVCTVEHGAVCVRTGCVPAALAPREAARYALIHRAVRGFDRIATCSEHMVRWLATEGVAATALPLAVEPPSPGFTRAPAAQPLVVTTSRLSPEKGVADLLDAAAGTGVRLRVVGTGPELPALQEQAARHNVDVDFRGAVPFDAIEDELRDAWALAVPSRWAEPLGLSAAEAIVRGIPAIVTATGGLPEVVTDGATGRTVPPGDKTALNAALTEVARNELPVDPAAAAKLAHKHSAAAYGAALETLLAEPGPRR